MHLYLPLLKKLKMIGQCILDIKWGAISHDNLKGYDKSQKGYEY